MISASDGEGSLSANKRPVVSKFHMSGWAEGISAGHSSGVVKELDGDGGIESNSIVSSAAGDHTARAVCCTWSAYCGAICWCGVCGMHGNLIGDDDDDDMMSERGL